jgi:LEA14-like dessication related protein
MKRVLSTLVLVLALAACSKPEPPQLNVKEVVVSAVSTRGVSLTLRVEAINPNSFAMTAQRFSGTVSLESGTRVGDFSVDKSIAVPAKSSVPIDVPFEVTWQDAAVVGTAALGGKDIPFKVEGKVALGGDTLQVSVPYASTGKISQAQLQEGAAKSLIPLLLGK